MVWEPAGQFYGRSWGLEETKWAPRCKLEPKQLAQGPSVSGTRDQPRSVCLSEGHRSDACTRGDPGHSPLPRLPAVLLEAWKLSGERAACSSRDGSGWENPACSASPQAAAISDTQGVRQCRGRGRKPGAASAGTRGPHPSSTRPGRQHRPPGGRLQQSRHGSPAAAAGPGQKLGRPSDPQRPEGAAGDL